MAEKQSGHPLFVRSAPVVEVLNTEIEPNTKYLLVALTRIHKALGPIARGITDLTKQVDEYSIVGSGGSSNVSTVEVLPVFDTLSELITSILVTGPVTTAFTL